MRENIQNEFERLVVFYYQRYASILGLSKPCFTRNGFITTAIMIGSCGQVEMRCGPAEYHVEIIINMLEKHTRLSLSDLMRIERIRNWILQNRPKTADRSILETEIDYAFYLVVEGLKGVADFEWIYSGDSMAES